MSPAPAPTPDRSAALRAVMDPRRLPTPPAVALQVVYGAIGTRFGTGLDDPAPR